MSEMQCSICHQKIVYCPISQPQGYSYEIYGKEVCDKCLVCGRIPLCINCKSWCCFSDNEFDMPYGNKPKGL